MTKNDSKQDKPMNTPSLYCRHGNHNSCSKLYEGCPCDCHKNAQLQSNQSVDKLRESLRDILFGAAGGVSDMANKEIDAVLALFATHNQVLKERLMKEKRLFTTLTQKIEGIEMPTNLYP